MDEGEMEMQISTRPLGCFILSPLPYNAPRKILTLHYSPTSFCPNSSQTIKWLASEQEIGTSRLKLVFKFCSRTTEVDIWSSGGQTRAGRALHASLNDRLFFDRALGKPDMPHPGELSLQSWMYRTVESVAGMHSHLAMNYTPTRLLKMDDNLVIKLFQPR